MKRTHNIPRLQRAGILLALATAIAGLGACRNHSAPIGVERGEVRRQADTLLRVLSAWTDPVVVDPGLAEFQSQLDRSFLTPSRVFRNESDWTGTTDLERRLETQGSVTLQGSRLDRASDDRPTTLPGEYRSRLSLEKLSKHEYEWRWLDELALGTFPVEMISRALQVVLSTIESPAPALEARLAIAMPRAAQALGRLYTIERLEMDPRPDGTTDFRFAAKIEPERIAAESPDYARYLERFASSSEMDVVGFDASGAKLWSVGFHDLILTAHLRIWNARLAPIEGPARRLPDEFRVKMDYSEKSGPFRVGFRNLETDVALIRTPTETGFIAAMNKSPDWRIPFLFDPFVKGALTRPFDGEGIVMRVALEESESDEEPTRIRSGFRMVVKETWVMRRLGDSGGRKLEDEADKEASRFHYEALEAVRGDIVALLDGSS